MPTDTKQALVLNPSVILGFYAAQLIYFWECNSLAIYKSDGFAHDRARPHLVVKKTGSANSSYSTYRISCTQLAALAGSIIQRTYHSFRPSCLAANGSTNRGLDGIHLGCPRKPPQSITGRRNSFCKCFMFFHIGLGPKKCNHSEPLFPCKRAWALATNGQTKTKCFCKCVKDPNNSGKYCCFTSL